MKPFLKIKRYFKLSLYQKRAKLISYFSVIRPAVTYACETEILEEAIVNRLTVFERKILIKIHGPNYENGVWRIKTNQELDTIIKRKNIINFAKAQKVRMVRSYRKNVRSNNCQSNTFLETHIHEANRKTKDTLGG